MNYIVHALPEHIDALASRVRKADLDELEAACFMDPKTALLMSLTLSVEAYTWMHGNEVVAVFGVAPDSDCEGVGCPWMIGSELVKRHRRYFLAHSRKFITRFNQLFPLLENYVHPTNAVSLRWLEWCGFEFAEPEPFGVKGELFVPFFKES